MTDILTAPNEFEKISMVFFRTHKLYSKANEYRQHIFSSYHSYRSYLSIIFLSIKIKQHHFILFNNVTFVCIYIGCWPWYIKGHTHSWRQIHVRSRQRFFFFFFHAPPPKLYKTTHARKQVIYLLICWRLWIAYFKSNNSNVKLSDVHIVAFFPGDFINNSGVLILFNFVLRFLEYWTNRFYWFIGNLNMFSSQHSGDFFRHALDVW